MNLAGLEVRKTVFEAINEHGAMQNPFELQALYGFLNYRIKPRIVVEIGSATGGTLYAWSQIPSVVKLISVTLTGDEYERGQLKSHGAKVIVGDSTLLKTQQKVMRELGDRFADFVFIDGGHDYDTAFTDWNFAQNIVEPNGVIAIHDIYLHRRLPEYQVGKLWREIRQANPGYLMWEIAVDPEEAPGVGIIWMGKQD